MSEANNKWLWDQVSPDLIQLHSIGDIVFSASTPFQKVEIAHIRNFGLSLLLDGKIQSCEKDEAVYHEALVHPAMIAHPGPKKVFIAGGGEGATLREVLAHKTVEQATMVDIDEEVVKICRKHLPSFQRGAFDDPRTRLHYADARDFLVKNKDLYDVIIVDLTDPQEGGLAFSLFTEDFFGLVRKRLAQGGVVSVQSGSTSGLELGAFRSVYNTLGKVFPVVFPYHIFVPSFAEVWGFCLASEGTAPAATPKEIDARIAARLSRPLQVYDGTAHMGMFCLPKHVRLKLGERGGNSTWPG